MPRLSSLRPDALPSPALLRRRCEALAHLDRAIDPDSSVPRHAFDRRAGVFWLREDEGNHVQIRFAKRGVLILGFDHESPLSPVHNHERTWPGVLDDLPAALRPLLRGYPYGIDVTFCIWRLGGSRRWQAGRAIGRPRRRDADGSARLLAILDGGPQRYRRFAKAVHGRAVPLSLIARAYAGERIDGAAIPAATALPPAPARDEPGAVAGKFPVGARVVDPWDSVGTITAVWPTLDAAAEAEMIEDPASWLRGLGKRPKTPRRGTWYSLDFDGGGSGLGGELDLRWAEGV